MKRKGITVVFVVVALSLFFTSYVSENDVSVSNERRNVSLRERDFSLNELNTSFSNDTRLRRTSFDDTLSSYRKFHDESLRSGRFETIVFVCERRQCSGWGDRVKGILTVFLLALYYDRTLVLNVNHPYPLENIYEGKINWNARYDEKNTVFSFDAFNRFCSKFHELLFSNDAREADELRISTNADCAGWIMRHPETSEKFKSLGLFDDANWRTKVFSFLFEPTKSFSETLADFLGRDDDGRTKFPRVAVHLRLGDVPGSPRNPQKQGGGDSNALVTKYEKCVSSAIENYRISPREKILVAADHEHALRALLDALKYENTFSADSVGKLGHVVFAYGKNGDIRLHVEFEIMRRAEYLFAGESGFSLMAYRVRENPASVIFATWDTCLWPWYAFKVAGD